MKNPFKREVSSYKGSEPQTPYQRAQQEWDSRIGTASSQAKNWRLLALLSLITTIFLIIILMLSISSRKDQIYVAEVTKDGRVVNVSPLMVRYNPNEAQKEYFVSQFINLVRGIPLDPVLAKKNWLNAYSFLTGRGAEILNASFRKESPTKLLGKKTITIEISDINPVSPTTMHVDWIETVVNNRGQKEAENGFSGIFTTAIKQPTKHNEYLRNPLGIYIVDFNITPKETKKITN